MTLETIGRLITFLGIAGAVITTVYLILSELFIIQDQLTDIKQRLFELEADGEERHPERMRNASKEAH